VRAGESYFFSKILELLPVVASAAHEEDEVDDVEQKADCAEGDPEETAEDDAEEEGDRPKEIAAEATPPEDGLIYVMGVESLVGEKHPFLIAGLQIYFHPPHHAD
jgi:hypothetical protein